MNGEVDLNGRALLKIEIRSDEKASNSPIEVWVDTGFTGDLVLQKSLIERLGFQHSLMINAVLADGRKSRMMTFSAWIDWFGEGREIEVVAGEDRTALLGVGLLLGHCLTVDYVALRLTLE